MQIKLTEKQLELVLEALGAYASMSYEAVGEVQGTNKAMGGNKAFAKLGRDCEKVIDIINNQRLATNSLKK